eukprot:2131297-Pyramimonas_sp.AAC.1
MGSVMVRHPRHHVSLSTAGRQLGSMIETILVAGEPLGHQLGAVLGILEGPDEGGPIPSVCIRKAPQGPSQEAELARRP